MASNNNQNGWFSGFGIGFSSGGSSTNPSAEKSAQSPSGTQPDMMHFEQLDRTTTGTNTLKVCTSRFIYLFIILKYLTSASRIN